MRRAVLVTAIAAVTVLAGLACQVSQGTAADPRIRVYADVDRPVVLAGRDEIVVIKVGLSALPDACRSRRAPLNVALVLDKSGSMGSEAKIENAKRGAIEVVERLNSDDVLALVVYDTGPRVVIPAQPVRDKQYLIDIISSITPGGRTALYGGVSLGADEVRQRLSWEYENRIILLSDGLANVGPSSPWDLARLGGDLAGEGITVTTIGVGTDYNEDLMTMMADKSGGNSYFAARASDLPEIFAEEIGDAMNVAARNVRIRVYCNGGTRPMAIPGRSGEISGQVMTVDLGKFYGKSDKYALFEVQVPREAAGGLRDVAEVSVEYADPTTNKSTAENRRVSVAYADRQQAVDDQVNKQVVKEVALTRTSDLKRQAVALADRGDAAGAAALVQKGAFELEKAAQQCDKDKEMLGEAAKCAAISQDITANDGLTKYQRKRVVNQAYTQTTQQSYVPEDKQPQK